MKVIVFTCHGMGCTGTQSLLDTGHDIAAIFTHPNNPGENHSFGSVMRLTTGQDIPVWAPEDMDHPLWIERIREMKSDVLFSFYYRSLLGGEILNLAPKGVFSLRGSLLSKCRGRAPLDWVPVNDESETGVTLHRIVNRVDTGDIVAQQTVAVGPDDAALTLRRKLRVAVTELLGQALSTIPEGKIAEHPQNHSQATCVGRRIPEDGHLNWGQPAQALYNLVRAVSDPWPGVSDYTGANKLIIWELCVRRGLPTTKPGTVISVAPLIVTCQNGALETIIGQTERGVCMQGAQLAQALGLVFGVVINSKPVVATKHRTHVLILSVNGFIGNHLTGRLLQDDNYEIYSLDIGSGATSRLLESPRFHFAEGNIGIHSEWIECHIKKYDVVLPLIAIATPIECTRNPLRVFELDFEENLEIIRDCMEYDKHVIFPSISEMYGVYTDGDFDEDASNLVVGPINRQRRIYSVSRQLLDHVIWAYSDKYDLKFALPRPFDWMGPRLDSLSATRIGSFRAVTQLILNPMEGSPIRLIEGDKQKYCFTDISDGIEVLFRIIENKDGRCDGRIINIGNPESEASIKELAEILFACFEHHPLHDRFPPFAGFRETESSNHYGKGYQDVEHRKPGIHNAKRCLNWEPRVEVEEMVGHALDFFLRTVELVGGKNP